MFQNKKWIIICHLLLRKKKFAFITYLLHLGHLLDGLFVFDHHPLIRAKMMFDMDVRLQWSVFIFHKCTNIFLCLYSLVLQREYMYKQEQTNHKSSQTIAPNSFQIIIDLRASNNKEFFQTFSTRGTSFDKNCAS